jgi:hypothetical protein
VCAGLCAGDDETDMDNENDDGAHHRRNKRSLVLLAAKVRMSKGELEVRLRNLSQNGALLEADTPPSVGTELVFERGETVVKARVAWVSDRRFGIEFLDPIEESEVLVHVGRPKTAPVEAQSFRRSGFRERNLSTGERKLAAAWVQSQGRALGD